MMISQHRAGADSGSQRPVYPAEYAPRPLKPWDPFY